METIVIFNMGRDARRAGQPCEVPSSVMYPIRSQYVLDHDVPANLSRDMQRARLEGWHWQPGDRHMDTVRRAHRAA